MMAACSSPCPKTVCVPRKYRSQAVHARDCSRRTSSVASDPITVAILLGRRNKLLTVVFTVRRRLVTEDSFGFANQIVCLRQDLVFQLGVIRDPRVEGANPAHGS